MVSRPLVHSTTYAYATASGAMTNISYSDSTPSVSFAYDRLGRQKVAQTFLSAHHFAYSPATLAIVSETVIDLQTGTSNVITRTTDALGRPSGLSLGSGYSVGYTFDEVGRFGSVTGFADGYSLTNRYGYLPGSDLLSGWSNGMVTVARSFEPSRDLLVNILNMAETNRVSRFDYSNDAIGRRTQRLDTLAGNPLPVTNDFAYNLRSELTAAQMGTNTYVYVFDPIGNRECERVNFTTNVYAANALNQYASVSNGVAWTPEYDLDGNILKLRDWTLQWDAENRLVAVSNSTEMIRYQHDYMGRRVWRAASGVTNRFDYDGWALIRDRTYTQTHTLTNTYFYGPDLSGELQGAGTIGGLWARVGEGGLLYYTYDGNGNVSDLVDPTGAIRGHYEYAPFGGLTAMTGDLAESNPFRFSTKRQDESTGLLYYGYRDLDTVWGRWVSRDPIGEDGGVNISGFVYNLPIGYIDDFGEKMREGVEPCRRVSPIPSSVSVLPATPKTAPIIVPGFSDLASGAPSSPYEAIGMLLEAPMALWTHLRSRDAATEEGRKRCKALSPPRVPAPPTSYPVLRCAPEYRCCVINTRVEGHPSYGLRYYVLSVSIESGTCASHRSGPWLGRPKSVFEDIKIDW
jgi:RHS repeat-associated protein